jgi:DNA-binding response OmpR family regulator/Tfp pilus assembly protein PilZ
MELLGSGSFPLLLVSETLSGLGGLYLVRQLRRAHPGVDALVSSWEPSLDLLGRAFELRILDIVRKPLPERQAFGEQLRAAIRRNVDQRMRRLMVQSLHAGFEELPEAVRGPTTRLLEQRLNAFKHSLGAFNRVLVVEGEDAQLRLLSENLLLAGLHVETTFGRKEALSRVQGGEIHMLITPGDGGEAKLRALISEVRAANPLAEVLLVCTRPDVEQARVALLMDAAGYLAWPPPAVPALVNRVQAALKRTRHERLLDNLVVELFRATGRALGCPPGVDYLARFNQLVGITRVGPEPSEPPMRAATGEAVEYLDDVLDNLLSPEDQELPGEGEAAGEAACAADPAANRRSHPRVLESQFVRFRASSVLSSSLALIGDLSEGGLFIRTADLFRPGTLLELEFQVMHEEQGYLVCCRAQVAWVARDDRQSPLGPGFGVKFIDAPEDVVRLLQQVVELRIRRQS